MQSTADDYRRIEKAILFLEKNDLQQPDLKEVARSVNLSEYHFQRLFKRWAGISPKRFLQVLTLERTKDLLKDPLSLQEVTGEAGLSSAGRLHDLFVNIESVTPGEFRKEGENVVIRYGFHPTPFGECLIAATDRGITNLSFVHEGRRSTALADLRKQWKYARISRDQEATGKYASRIFASGGNGKITVVLKGTNFQVKVWQALLKIPGGRVTTYEKIAAAAGKPDAVRAAANAVGRNPIAFLIPCHRVIRKTGALGGYHWGLVRKKAMLARERA